MATKKVTTAPTEIQAVIELKGKQYLVKPNQTIRVDKLEAKEGDTIKISEVLLVINGDDTMVGAPFLKDTSVVIKHDKIVKGDKLEIYKFKAKSRYRRHTGHRQDYSQITVSAINLK